MLKLRGEEEGAVCTSSVDAIAPPDAFAKAGVDLTEGEDRKVYLWIAAGYVVLGLLVAGIYRNLEQPGESGLDVFTRLLFRGSGVYVLDGNYLPVVTLTVPIPILCLFLLLFPDARGKGADLKAAAFSTLGMAFIGAGFPIKLSSGVCFMFASGLLGFSFLHVLESMGRIVLEGERRPFRLRRLSLMVGIATLGAMVLMVLEFMASAFGPS